MAPTVAFGHPTSFRAGDTVVYRIAFTDYPVSESYVYSFVLVSTSSSTQAPLQSDSSWITDDGHEYTVTLPAATTADLGAGAYILTSFATLAGVRATTYSAGLMVEDNPVNAVPGSKLAHAEKQLAAVEDELEARVTGTGSAHESYQIGGRAINKMSVAELRKYRGALKAEVTRLRGGRRFGQDIHFRFVGPTPMAGWE